MVWKGQPLTATYIRGIKSSFKYITTDTIVCTLSSKSGFYN